MLYLTCTRISSVDLAQYGVALAKDWVSVECGTTEFRFGSKQRKQKSSSCYTQNSIQIAKSVEFSFVRL